MKRNWLSWVFMFLMMVVIVEFNDGTTRTIEDAKRWTIAPVSGALEVYMDKTKGYHLYVFSSKNIRSYEIYKK